MREIRSHGSQSHNSRIIRNEKINVSAVIAKMAEYCLRQKGLSVKLYNNQSMGKAGVAHADSSFLIKK